MIQHMQNVKNGIPDFKLRFYEVMKYPLPLNKGYFLYKEELKNTLEEDSNTSNFSREEKNQYMDTYLKFIKRRWFLYKSFPFVREIYLSNSISFNALTKNSDIDIFVVTQDWRVRTSRLFMSIMMAMIWIKRRKGTERKKFCLSFFVEKYNSNLEKIWLWEKDIYLPYWIAHLVPLYIEKTPTIYKTNNWIKKILPNVEKEQMIFLWNKVYKWKTRFKKIMEFLLRRSFWETIEAIIQIARGRRIRKIIKLNPEIHEGVIVNKSMLKFHLDKRNHYSELFFQADN